MGGMNVTLIHVNIDVSDSILLFQADIKVVQELKDEIDALGTQYSWFSLCPTVGETKLAE